MVDEKIFPVPENYKKNTHVTKEIYEELYKEAQSNPEKFWGEIGKRINWIKPYTKIKDVKWSKDEVDINKQNKPVD